MSNQAMLMDTLVHIEYEAPQSNVRCSVRRPYTTAVIVEPNPLRSSLLPTVLSLRRSVFHCGEVQSLEQRAAPQGVAHSKSSQGNKIFNVCTAEARQNRFWSESRPHWDQQFEI